MKKDKPIPFDSKLSADLDKAIVASESKDKLRRAFGKRWKQQLECQVFGDE